MSRVSIVTVKLEDITEVKDNGGLISLNLSLRNRYFIVVLIGLAATLAPLASTIYFPARHSIQADLDASNEALDLSITSFMIVYAILPLIWGMLSDHYGRQKVFLVSQFCFIVGNLGCGLSNNIEMLIGMRAIQSLGASAPTVTGVGTIMDLFPNSQERGPILSYFFMGPLLGPILGPVIGNLINETWGWRSIFWFLLAFGIILFLAFSFLAPETLSKTTYQKPLRNPLQPLLLLKYPLVQCASFCSATTFASFFAIEACLNFELPRYYSAVSSSELGWYQLPIGLGTILGNLLVGKLSNHHEIQLLSTSRLKGLWLGPSFSLIGFLLFGVSLHLQLHITVPLIGTFLSGMGMAWCLVGFTNYLITFFPNQPSSISATAASIRIVLASILSPFNSQLFLSLGPLITSFIYSGLLSLGFLSLIILYKYSHKLHPANPLPIITIAELKV